jgi:hypothetical protein
MKCIECESEYKGNEVKNSQGYCSVECYEKYNDRLMKAKLYSVKNICEIDRTHEKGENRMTLVITVKDVTEKEYEKLMNTDHYIIEVDTLRNKIKFKLH